jgi:hypothetical protein
MRSRGVIALLATACVGILAAAFVGARDSRELAFTLGVVPAAVAAELAPGQTVCQAPVNVPTDFDRVRFQVGTYRRPGPPMRVAVRSAGSRRLLAGGRLPAGYPDVSQPVVVVGEVRASQRAEVCLTNSGRRRLALYGNATAAAPVSDARLGNRPLGTDLTLMFERGESRSMVSLLPDVFDRASLFRPGWVGAWTFWVLAVLLLAGVPLLLALAVARSRDRGEPDAAEAEGDAKGERATRPRVPARAP